MSIKRVGRRTGCARVSLSPSKIPYVGFSPIRLQTGRQVRPSTPRVLYAPQARFLGNSGYPSPHVVPKGTWQRIDSAGLQSRGPSLDRGFCCPTVSSATMASSEPLGASRQLMYSHDGSLLHSRSRVVPHFSLRVCGTVPPSVPRRTERLRMAVPSPFVQAFVISAVTRPPQTPRTPVLTQLCFEAAKFALCYGPVPGSPYPGKDFYTRAFTPEVTSMRCRVSLRGLTANSRDRTSTGYTRSVVGCEQRSQRKSEDTEVDGVVAYF